MIGVSLERAWGAFRQNLYIFSGLLGQVIGAFLVYAFTGIDMTMLNTSYLNASMFFAYAALFPNMQFYFYFIIPIKAKWMALLSGVFYIYEFFAYGIETKVMIVMSLINFLVFFLATRNYRRISPIQIKKRRTFEKNARPVDGPKHKCAVCGRTELDGDDLEFRYCSKCDGQYEYCQDHLYTHKHVTAQDHSGNAPGSIDEPNGKDFYIWRKAAPGMTVLQMRKSKKTQEDDEMAKIPFVTLDQVKEIVKKYPTPFHIYDEKGIRENARRLKKAFAWNKGFREYFAVKATPNHILWRS